MKQLLTKLHDFAYSVAIAVVCLIAPDMTD